MVKEFQIGDTVTLDRYNHIDDVEVVKVVGYGRMPTSKTLTYKMDLKGVIIESTGASIMESKLYTPVKDYERYHRKKASTIELDEWCDRMYPRKNKDSW